MWTLCWVMTVLMSTGCEKVLDIAGPAYKRQVVLVGLLQPDSAISVRLVINSPANQLNHYDSIENATVTFYENNHVMGVITSGRKGNYQLTKKPKVGSVYRVEAMVPDYGQLVAQDSLPGLAPARLTDNGPNSANPNNNPDFTLSWQPSPSSGRYWLSAYVLQVRMVLGPGCPANVNGLLPPGCTFVDKLETTYDYVLTNNILADRFSASYDSYRGAYSYGGLLRMLPDYLGSQPAEFTFTLVNQFPPQKNRKPGEGLMFDFLIAGPQYDRFLKSAVQSAQNRVLTSEDVLSNPFAEITPVYSNVTNGQGIFGAMSRQRITY